MRFALWYNAIMRPWVRIATATIFVAILLGLGIADALLTNRSFIFPNTENASSSEDTAGTVAKNNGIALDAILKDEGITTSSTNDQSLLSRIVGSTAAVHTQVLLKDNDRIAFFSWIENPEVKKEFDIIKDTLHASFSPNVSDLRDVTEFPTNGPPRNVLSFRDPALGEEKMVFLRVRQRLFEIHIAKDKDADADSLVEALSR